MQTLVRAFVRYHKGMGRMPWYWRPFLAALFVANLVMPLVFITRAEAQVVFLTTIANSALFTLLTAAQGFTRLLSLAHLPWIPLIYYLATRLDDLPADNAYGIWLRVLLVLNAASLMIDTVNVIRFLAGDRGELVTGLSDQPGQPEHSS
ncbi:MAG: hypothetical protein GTO53_04500 [Planctomycetales bacterium]|nr:hypothetical protein [Planctomycetales bacterium]NIM08417.1 hypothetical protein [Planctomycetales bacterium]NIN07893.1 hypothetical protein [Planctomycetales bacterium]NIN77023.1 hypothetical protein [Planctomycetales bacterium]NIO34205.1 hypothetical protein [Planctomycetales bacterium]